MKTEKDVIIVGDETISISVSVPRDTSEMVKHLLKGNLNSACGDFYLARNGETWLRKVAEINAKSTVEKVSLFSGRHP